MLFNSLEFALFLPLVFILYWLIVNKTIQLQNGLLVIASSIFYGWWDWRFLLLLYFTAFLDYLISFHIAGTEIEKKRKLLVGLSITANLIVLGFFKYFNFFVDSWISAFANLGIEMHRTSLNIVLPVGISFYTFQSIGYTIDVYRKKLTPPKDIVTYFAFVSFFPQLVAGPIERATHMIPQFSRQRMFNYVQAKSGLQQILWGLLKKIVIADNCAVYANNIFDNYETQSGSTLVLGAIYFSFQIYCDFSGYSDIAIGTARLFGFELMQNFRYPYFSRNISEFWRRWHISLSTWFRDYVYIPLGGNKGGFWFKFRNTMIIFTISGLWHGANWTYVFWGVINGLYFIPLLLQETSIKVKTTEQEPQLKDLHLIIGTFLLTCFTWIFFRSPDINHAFGYIKGIFSMSLLSIPTNINFVPAILLFVLAEWLQRDKAQALEINSFSAKVRLGIYYSLIIAIVFLGNFGYNTFIYFQF
jgi:D-alanyl-lipoteichoic acid acyltransferase DltB (MBOAT superfamily)